MQEDFHAIEYIHGLMCIVKKTPNPQLMEIYYSKLTKIFWVSEGHLHHAYALYKLYILQKSYNKNLTQKDLQLMESSVFFTTISIMPYDHKHGAHHFQLENEKEMSLRMATFLGFSWILKMTPTKWYGIQEKGLCMMLYDMFAYVYFLLIFLEFFHFVL